MTSRTLGFVLLAAVATGLSGGCSEQSQPTPEPAVRPPAPTTVPSGPVVTSGPSNLTYEDVIAHLEGEGHVIGESKETYAKMIGAEEGYRVDIDGHPFEIYVFEVETTEGQLAFKKVKKEGVFGVQAETYGNLAFFRAMKDPHPEFLTLVESIQDMY
jgi:hypothetical protein